MPYGQLVLYSYWRSSSSYRVRLALAYKGLAYATVPVNLRAGEQHEPAHLARNPLATVPCLQIGQQTVIESVAILELLEELYPTPPLLPSGPVDRARVRSLVQVINADTQPMQNVAVLQRLPDDAARRTWREYFISRGLGAFESLMQAHARAGARGRFAYGDTPTMADMLLVPQVYNARRFNVDLHTFPRIKAAVSSLLSLEWVQGAAPENQPDAVRDE